jgi:hypothetical protein
MLCLAALGLGYRAHVRIRPHAVASAMRRHPVRVVIGPAKREG